MKINALKSDIQWISIKKRRPFLWPFCMFDNFQFIPFIIQFTWKNSFWILLLCVTELLWPKSKRRNSVDEFEDASPHKMAKCMKGPIFITLANESPARNYDSEDSTYDSFHARETGKQVDVRLKCVSILYC